MRLRRGLALAALAIAVVGGCGGDGGEGQSASVTAGDDDSGSNTVILKGNEFRPEKLTIAVGETVTWEWDDGQVAHDVNGGDLFKSEIQEEGTFEHTFEEAGVFEYKCTVHPSMTGSVEVTE